MVAIREHRIGSGGLAKSPPTPAAHREVFEAAADQGGAQEIRAHRISVSVLAKTPVQVGVHRETFEAATEQGGAQETREHRIGLNVFMKSPPKIGVQREVFEAAVDVGTAQPAHLHRFSVSVLGRASVPAPTPVTLAANQHFFLHNWASRVVIETSYQTDVFRSPRDGAEERPSRTQRPDRIIDVSWLREGEEEIRQLLKLLRRMTDENVQLPLYPDVVSVTSAWTTASTTVSCNTRNRRFFVGSRVLLYPQELTHITDTQAIIKTISSLTATSLTFDSVMPNSAAANSYNVVPLLDCEIVLEPTVNMLTDLDGEVVMTVREIHGANALPPLAVGNPDGADMRSGYPVFEIDPNWVRGLETIFVRYGDERRLGLRLTPSVDSTRYVLKQEWNLSPLDRDEFGFVAGFFDTRRGRGRSFWVIDRHDTFTVITNLSNTIFVEPKGDFDDFAELWTEQNIGAGIVMEDGTTYASGVFSVNDNGSTWSLTLDVGQTLPTLDVTQIKRFARARLSRFETDVIREIWQSTDVCEISLSTIETLNEKGVTF